MRIPSLTRRYLRRSLTSLTHLSDEFSRQQLGDVKKSDLPGPEALSREGKKDGQVIMVRNSNGGVEAHQVWITSASSLALLLSPSSGTT